MPNLCPSCGKPPDWRGLQKHHIVLKGLGGDPKGLRKETELLCARCHAKRHGIREVDSKLRWRKGDYSLAN